MPAVRILLPAWLGRRSVRGMTDAGVGLAELCIVALVSYGRMRDPSLPTV